MSSQEASRGRRVSGRQLDILWEFLNSHRDIAVAYNRSLQAKEKAKRKWLDITQILNSQGDGAHKDWKSWSKYWVDYKAKLKKRATALRSSAARTGGGPSLEPPLSEFEKKFLQILGEDIGEGLPGVRVEPFAEIPQNDAAGGEVMEESPSVLPPSPNIPVIQVMDAVPEVHSSERTPSLSPQFSLTAQTPRRSPRRPPSHFPTLASQPALAASPIRSPRRRRVRREPPMSQGAARRALVQSSQLHAEASMRAAIALEAIAQALRNNNTT